jgi:hypothetical protein
MAAQYEEDVKFIIKKLGLPKLTMQTVEDVYPGNIDDVYKRWRRADLVAWRSCLYIYEIMNGSNLRRIGEKYDVSHATVLSAIKRLKGFAEINQRNNFQYEIFNYIIENHNTPIITKKFDGDICTDIALSQFILQSEIAKKFGKLWT